MSLVLSKFTQYWYMIVSWIFLIISNFYNKITSVKVIKYSIFHIILIIWVIKQYLCFSLSNFFPQEFVIFRGY